jgi:hypothetical protein
MYTPSSPDAGEPAASIVVSDGVASKQGAPMNLRDSGLIASFDANGTIVPTQFPPKASVVQPGVASLHAKPPQLLFPPKPTPLLTP